MPIRSGVFLSLARWFQRLAGASDGTRPIPGLAEQSRDEERFSLGAYRCELVDGGTLEDHLTRDALTFDPKTGLATVESYSDGGSAVVRMEFLAEVGRLWDASFAVRRGREQARHEEPEAEPSDLPLRWRERP